MTRPQTPSEPTEEIHLFLKSLHGEIEFAFDTFRVIQIIFTDDRNQDVYPHPFCTPPPVVLNILYPVMLSASLLSISKIMDPAITKIGRVKKKNASLMQAIDLVKGHSKVYEQASRLYEKLSSDFMKIKEWRNQHLSHSDYELSVGGSALPSLGQEEVYILLCDIEHVFNYIARNLGAKIALDFVHRGEEAANFILSVFGADRYAKMIALYIERVSEDKDNDYRLFSRYFAGRWESTEESRNLLDRAILYDKQIREKYKS